MSQTDDVIRVLLADDHQTTRIGIRAILEKAPDFQVVGEAADGIEAQKLTEALHPDILLLDLRMPGPGPAEVARWVRTHCPETTTLVLTAHDRDDYLAAMIEADAGGFLTKEEADENLIGAIRRAARGEILFNREQQTRARHWREEVGERWASLTGREREVVMLIADGRDNKQIAEALTISRHTVETHIGNILGKLAVASRTEAAVWIWHHNLAEEMDLSGGNQPEENG